MGSIKNATLYEVSNTGKDIALIFIHGLNGHPFETWKRDSITKSLPDLIHHDLEIKGFDVFTFGYKTGLFTKQYDFKLIAQLLYGEIMANLSNRKIVFVGHSMGGLVIQQFIVDQYKDNSEQNLKSIQGAIFLCVPFKGSQLASLYLGNKQTRSLRKSSTKLSELKENWVKYTLRGGSKSVPKNMVHRIPQLLIYGAQDAVVGEMSAAPLHLDDALKYAVDVDHKGVCKIDENSTVYKHMKSFLLNEVKHNDKKMILSIQGYDKQTIDGASISLDWTGFFKGKPRIYPPIEVWNNEIKQQLEHCIDLWDETWSKKSKIIRIHAKLPLPAGVLIGNYFPRTKGTILEVEQNGEIWSSEFLDSNYKPNPQYHIGNSKESNRAILVLSVSKDIHNEVDEFLKTKNEEYRVLVNILPDGPPNADCIKSAEQAVAYSANVKEVAEELKSKGINEFYLFINTPFSVSVFVGHFLTVMPPIQTFDYKLPGYIESCVL